MTSLGDTFDLARPKNARLDNVDGRSLLNRMKEIDPMREVSAVPTKPDRQRLMVKRTSDTGEFLKISRSTLHF